MITKTTNYNVNNNGELESVVKTIKIFGILIYRKLVLGIDKFPNTMSIEV